MISSPRAGQRHQAEVQKPPTADSDGGNRFKTSIGSAQALLISVESFQSTDESRIQSINIIKSLFRNASIGIELKFNLVEGKKSS